MLFRNPLNRSILILSFFGYVLLLFRHGYTFGWGDHAEILPYLSSLFDDTLYPHDFYVEHIQSIVPNVRWVFVHALLPFYRWLEPVFFICHALFSLTLLYSTLKFAHLSGLSLLPSFVGLMAYLLIFYGKIPGGNDWYLNNFQAENIAFTLGILAMVLWTDKKDITAFVLLAIGTLFHPLAGIQFFILLFGLALINRRLSIKAISIYLLTGGLYFLMIYLSQGKSVPGQTPSYFDILFQFRQPHHSLPSHFPKIGWILTVICVWTIWTQRKQSPAIFQLMVFIVSGALFYVIGVSLFHAVPVAQSQWFKTFALLFALGSISVANLVFHRFNFLKRPISFNYFYILYFSLLALLALFLFPGKNPFQKPFTTAGFHSDPFLIDCCERIQTMVPKDALFVVPFDCDAFNHYSKRSVYVNFKAVAHDESSMREWYRRIQQVYGLTVSDAGGFSMAAKANAYYQNQLEAVSNGLPAGFVADYALVRGKPFHQNVVYENAGYQVISLKSSRLYAQKFTFSR